jgi:AbiV family abortive infection protein
MVDLATVKAADTAELSACAVAAARNALALLHDAEALNDVGCWARALALSVMGVEEAGKAVRWGRSPYSGTRCGSRRQLAGC